MAQSKLDVLVIGGGIVGAGVARDAAMRGMRVALVERTDFAAGTSGKTSKLVHGGLRYLEDFRLGLVRTAIRERDLWLRQEPRLVTPLEFVIPVYRGGDAGWKVRLALRAYAWLSRGAGRRARMLSREGVAAEEPSLAPPGLRGGGKYMDAAVPDARFVWAVIAAATDAGATVLNHAEVTGLVVESGRVVGANVTDSLGGEKAPVRARIVVNAAGPWLDRVRALAVNSKPALRPTKGIHILVPRERIGNRHAAALRASDGRLVFVIPWGGFSLIGTTDTDYRGDPETVQATDADVAYLLAAANLAFPTARLTPADVVSTYAGVRPLVESGRPAQESDISREHELLHDAGMMSIAGGKLTTYRAMAEEVVDAITKHLGGNFRSCRTADVPLRPPPDPRAADELRALVAKPELIDRLL
ncbi:MAG TPA: glycerol-3-phosphate dehydrogenase/oxidase, partial [Thermoplasmata archaeon]|nr:glycerol-3-phosphate dehydrogenase/oxidase [Thermoplasmata archaeon]